MTTTPAATMEEAIKAVLHEAKLTPEDRDVLEKAVRIARTLQKAPKGSAEKAPFRRVMIRRLWVGRPSPAA
jgi:hypothetical protein